MRRWCAAAGAFAPNLHGTMPAEASPCGTVMERDCVLLFNEAERFFRALRGVEPQGRDHVVEQPPGVACGREPGGIFGFSGGVEHDHPAGSSWRRGGKQPGGPRVPHGMVPAGVQGTGFAVRHSLLQPCGIERLPCRPVSGGQPCGRGRSGRCHGCGAFCRLRLGRGQRRSHRWGGRACCGIRCGGVDRRRRRHRPDGGWHHGLCRRLGRHRAGSGSLRLPRDGGRLGQGLPHPDAHFGQHGALAGVEKQAHGQHRRHGRRAEERENGMMGAIVAQRPCALPRRARGCAQQPSREESEGASSMQHMTMASSRPPPTAG